MRRLTKLRVIRMNKGFNVKEMAEMIGVDASLVSAVELRIAFAYPKMRRRIAEVLGITEDEVFRDGLAMLYEEEVDRAEKVAHRH